MTQASKVYLKKLAVPFMVIALGTVGAEKASADPLGGALGGALIGGLIGGGDGAIIGAMGGAIVGGVEASQRRRYRGNRRYYRGRMRSQSPASRRNYGGRY